MKCQQTLVALQQILSKVTGDAATVAAAKTAIDNLLDVRNGLPGNVGKDFQLNEEWQGKRSNLLSMPLRISIATELIF